MSSRWLLSSLLPCLALGQGGYCGNATVRKPGNNGSVLLIGDSISMAVPYTPGGYGVVVQQLLGAKGISVEHNGGWYNGGQASNTVKGLNCTDPTTDGNWLDFDGQFDVIHFNFGLHDLVNCTNNPECSEHVDPQTYGANLQTIYNRLAAKARKGIIFATTTPVPNCTTSLGRSYELSIKYNTAATQALATIANVVFDDLWSVVIKACGIGYTSCPLQLPANVHFTPAGQQVLGAAVSASILAMLGM